MKHQLKCLLSAVLLISAGLITACTSHSAVTRDVLRLTNIERQAYGLPALLWDNSIAAEAYAHSRDMAIRGFFAHKCPDGVTASGRLDGLHNGVDIVSYTGENLARRRQTAEEVIESWMDSPEHRANILHPDFTHMGVGLYINADGEFYWTQKFIG